MTEQELAAIEERYTFPTEGLSHKRLTLAVMEMGKLAPADIRTLTKEIRRLWAELAKYDNPMVQDIANIVNGYDVEKVTRELREFIAETEESERKTGRCEHCGLDGVYLYTDEDGTACEECRK